MSERKHINVNLIHSFKNTRTRSAFGESQSLKEPKYQIFNYVCHWHFVYMLIFYSSYHFLSSSYLIFPVFQMNVCEIKCILKCCEVSTMIFSSNHPLGGFFSLVCSVVRIGKEKTLFSVVLKLLFPSLLPGASLYFALSLLSHLAWFSCHLCWVYTSARRLILVCLLWFQHICLISMDVGKGLCYKSGLD